MNYQDALGLSNSTIQFLPNLSVNEPSKPKNISDNGPFTLPPADNFSKSEWISFSLLQIRQRCTVLPSLKLPGTISVAMISNSSLFREECSTWLWNCAGIWSLTG